MTTSPAHQLFIDRRFDEAVDAYKRQLLDNPREKWANIDGLGQSLMGAGRYAEAIPRLEEVDKYDKDCPPGSPGRSEQLSVCHWMIGDRECALAIIKELVIGVRDGKITFTDFAGGTSQGVILCYMAATMGVPSDIELAMTYLKKLAKSRYITSWPGPAALFLLGRMSFDDAAKSATGFADLTQAKNAAEHGLLKRRWLTNLLFAAAVGRRLASDEPGCRRWMAECAGLTNPLVEYEWYLAKSEIPAAA
jgi:hypothetical protein